MAEKKAAAKSSKKAKAAKPKAKAKKAAQRKAKASQKSGAKKAAAKKASAKAAARKPTARKAAPKRASSKATSGLDKSVAQFRESLEQSVTLSRDRIQEVVDDAVKRGRMTRGDAEKMLSDLVKRGRKQTDSLLGELERLVKQARKEVGGRAEPVPQTGHPGSAPRARKNSARDGRRPPARSRRPAAPVAASCSRSRSTRSPSAGAASPAPTASSSSSPARCPGDRVRVEVTKGEEALRRGAHGRAAAARRRPRPRPLHPRRRALPRRPLAGPPLRAPAGRQAGAGRRGAAPDRRPRGLRAGGDRRRRAAVALPQQARVLLRRTTTASRSLGFHARGRWDLIVDVEDCHLASEAGNAARNEVRDWARLESVPAYDAPRPPRRAAQPRRPRGPAHRPDPDPPRHRPGAASRNPRSTSTRSIEGDSGGTDGPTGVLGEERLREELCGLKLRDLPRRLLPDQHRDGRAPLRGRRRVRRPHAAASGSSTSSAGSARSG